MENGGSERVPDLWTRQPPTTYRFWSPQMVKCSSVNIWVCLRTLNYKCSRLGEQRVPETPRACFLGGFGTGFSKRNWFRSLMASARIRPFRRQSEIVFIETPHAFAISSFVSIPRSRSRSTRLLSPWLFECSRRWWCQRQIVACLKPLLVENSRHVCVFVIIQEVVQFGNHSQILLVAFAITQRPRQHQRFRLATAEANVKLYLLAFSYSNVFDEKTNHPLAFAVRSARIVPQL